MQTKLAVQPALPVDNVLPDHVKLVQDTGEQFLEDLSKE